MDRRTLIKSAAVLAAPAIVTNARAQSVTTLRFHTFVPAMSTAYSRLITPWMAKIEQESGGRLKFQAFPSMQMGGAPAQLYDQARDGVVDVVWSLAGYTPGRFPRSEAFELPFFTYDAEGSSRAAWDYIANYAPDEFREVKLLACHTHGLNILHMKSKLVTKASDMRGLKVRGSTRKNTQILSAVGAIPVSAHAAGRPAHVANTGGKHGRWHPPGRAGGRRMPDRSAARRGLDARVASAILKRKLWPVPPAARPVQTWRDRGQPCRTPLLQRV